MKATFHQQFIRFIKKKRLFTPADRLLVALSGGVDSVVLAHVLKATGFNFSIAHCNFKLRGAESNADERFVCSLAEALQVQVHIRHFNTAEYAASLKISIQLAARELRYAWFEEIRQREGYDYIFTAHQKNDLAETVLMNLANGAVVKGLRGIQAKSGYLIRPLLWASKEAVLNYANAENISYREDSSNASDKYTRNLIRHNILPEFEKLNPGFTDIIAQSSFLRGQVAEWFEKYCLDLKQKLFTPFLLVKTPTGANEEAVDSPPLLVLSPTSNAEAPLRITASISAILAVGANEAILYEWLKEYNFNTAQVINLFESFSETETRQFYSNTHQLIKDREKIYFFLHPDVTKQEAKQLLVKAPNGKYQFGIRTLSLELLDQLQAKEDLTNPAFAFLDNSKLQFPLEIRKWQHGDHFHPYGMKGRKKLSDYFTDIKLGALEKEEQLVVLSGQAICWLAGHRIDEGFKVTKETKQILKITIH